MDDGDLGRGMRVGIGRRRRAVRGPAGVGNADGAGGRIGVQHPGEIGKLAFGPAPHQRATMQRADAGAVITAVLHAPEAIDQPVGHAGAAHDSDYAAHCLPVLPSGPSATL